eukprot:312990-Rhodomonas_salina.2
MAIKETLWKEYETCTATKRSTFVIDVDSYEVYKWTLAISEAAIPRMVVSESMKWLVTNMAQALTGLNHDGPSSVIQMRRPGRKL